MKLLIVTQKVDKNDDVLGFFHRWILEFAKHYEFITVIVLQVGEYDLPKNVKVLSLGKRKSVKSRAFDKIKYIYKFYKYIWSERKNYDAVFVHMNQEYVLLGWGFFKLWNKKIFLWRNHAKGNWITRMAVLFSDKVFCTSPQSFTAKFKKTKIMPVGIDTNFFKPDSSVNKKPNSILFLGRISPVKNVDIFVEALKELRDGGVEFSTTIAGASSVRDIKYEKMIRDKTREYGLDDKVVFTGAVSQTEALRLYREHELYVNLTPSGSMDKTIFEAMACQTIVIVENESLKDSIPQEFFFSGSTDDLADKIEHIILLPIQEKEEVSKLLRKTVIEKHSLSNLGLKLSINLKHNE